MFYLQWSTSAGYAKLCIPCGLSRLDFDELKEAIELQLKIAARSIKDAIPNEPPKEQP